MDGRLVRSGGVDLRNREMEVLIYSACSRCNQVRIGASESELQGPCPFCNERFSPPKKFIQPIGFTTLVEEQIEFVRLHRVKPPSTSEVFLIDGADPSSFAPHRLLSGVSVGYRRDGELFRANAGRKGKQFKLCRRCGRGFEKESRPHNTPWGSKCKGAAAVTVDLVCRFRTDTLQIRFDGMSPPPPTIDDRAFWYSFQTAFVGAAAEVLAIPSNDLGGSFRSQSEGSLRGELVVYDRVQGGGLRKKDK